MELDGTDFQGKVLKKSLKKSGQQICQGEFDSKVEAVSAALEVVLKGKKYAF